MKWEGRKCEPAKESWKYEIAKKVGREIEKGKA